MKHLLSAEPAVIIALVAAALNAAVRFGFGITDDQIQAVIDLVTAMLATLAIRQSVYSPSTHKQVERDTYVEGYMNGERGTAR